MTKGRKRLKIACPGCRQKLDLSDIEPFSRIDCPSCGDEIIVPKPFGDLMLEEPLSEREPVAVYRALDLTLDREVAVKTMRPTGPEAAAIRSAFLRQARQSAAVNHPHIVPIYSCGDVGDASYLVMQFMSDGALTGKIRHGGVVDTEWATHMIVEVALGLQAAHKQGLTHGDVRPGNILFDADGHVKISDFGLLIPLLEGQAGSTAELKHWNAFAYASPERRGGGPGDVRSDIYSLGATLYQVLTGHLPTDEVARAGGSADTPLPPAELNDRIPAALSECTMRMMDPAPEKRPGDYTGVIDALRALGRRRPGVVGVSAAGGRGSAAGTARVNGRRSSVGGGSAAGGAALRMRAAASGAGADGGNRERQWGWLNVALALALVILLALFGFLLLRDRNGSPPDETDAAGTMPQTPAVSVQAVDDPADEAPPRIAPPALHTPVQTPSQPPLHDGGWQQDEADAPPTDDPPPAAAPVEPRTERAGAQDPPHGGGTEYRQADAPQETPAGRPEKPARDAAGTHRRRPKPAGLDFMAAKDDLRDYLLNLPPAERTRERERLGLISDSREYLLQLMRYMPFEPRNGRRIQLRDGTSLDGAVPYCNENEVAVRLHGRGKRLKRLAWTDLAFDQFVDFFEFYIDTRLAQGGKAGSAVLTDEQRRAVGDDCLRLAVLCDWYGHAEARDRNARRALRYAPEKRGQIADLLPEPAD